MQRIRKVMAAGLLFGLVLAGAGRDAIAAATASGGAGARINLNSATADELARLPGVGPAKAKAIVEYRASDPFKSVDDLKKVKGIGDKMLDALRPELTVGPEVGAR